MVVCLAVDRPQRFDGIEAEFEVAFDHGRRWVKPFDRAQRGRHDAVICLIAHDIEAHDL